MTDDIVGAYLRLDRAITHVVEFFGFDMNSTDSDVHKEFTDAIAELDAAQDDMQIVHGRP